MTDWEKSHDLLTRLTTPEAPYTGDQVRDAMIAADIQQVMHHRCSLCQCWVFYLRRGEELFFSSGCRCSWYDPTPRTWENAAEWLNMQGDAEVKLALAAAFGLRRPSAADGAGADEEAPAGAETGPGALPGTPVEPPEESMAPLSEKPAT